ncbi:LysR family transcriptional regulator [Mesorhizobium sp.]|uniref:LysR family transcriptional regulator n=1 Tax=Mesorhizobium sp. TaxID=1871066 RepID=UPI000FE2C43E|nr:LysR family transcriptional regulator [Mesorhizobium sp.]RWN59811.1 MAG: LysR family transcriptional regulator [Mesorhizobium sp.]RWO41963.1 MAG: LysR family transcriptional regulator [Mesorhizobium sp.]RWQ06063.1 MAG: LysR family transcriptional regulator [Mesorhizobium sp.]RWQ50787.1 MAG: LysR family transcriptional regulator [Mesorhizobium sp.]
MDRLTELTSFVRACDTASFSAAARELGLSQPAVSQQIRALEKRLGVRLFDRTTRHVSPTEAGRRYLERARDIIERLEEADRSVGCLESKMCGRLAVGAPASFGAGVLGSYLIEFKRAYPELLLDVALTDSFVDVIAEGLDVAIRMGTIDDDRLIVRKLGVIGRCLAATPEYLDRRGRPRRPEDLADHDYLLYAHIRKRDVVPLTGPGGEKAEVRIRPAMRSDNSLLNHQALLSGVGIGLGHRVILDPLIAEGLLEHVLPDWHYAPHHVHAVYPSNRFIPLKVRRFVAGFADHLAAMGAFIDDKKTCTSKETAPAQ